MANNQTIQLGTLDKSRLDDAAYVDGFVRGRCAQANCDLAVTRLTVSKSTGMITAELVPLKIKFTD